MYAHSAAVRACLTAKLRACCSWKQSLLQGITIPATKAAPLAIARTKSTMSLGPQGAMQKFIKWFVPDAIDTPGPTPHHTQSRATSRRSSFDRSDSTMREATLANGAGPIEYGRTEGAVIEDSMGKANDESAKRADQVERHFDAPPLARGTQTPPRAHSPVGKPLSDLDRVRQESGPPTPNGLKVEFSLPNSH